MQLCKTHVRNARGYSPLCTRLVANSIILLFCRNDVTPLTPWTTHYYANIDFPLNWFINPNDLITELLHCLLHVGYFTPCEKIKIKMGIILHILFKKRFHLTDYEIQRHAWYNLYNTTEDHLGLALVTSSSTTPALWRRQTSWDAPVWGSDHRRS